MGHFLFQMMSCAWMQGDLYDHESLVKAIKEVDVVISTVGHLLLADQDRIISAIKEAGNVKVQHFHLNIRYYLLGSLSS